MADLGEKIGVGVVEWIRLTRCRFHCPLPPFLYMKGG